MDIIDSRVIEIARRRLEGIPSALADFTQDYKLASKAPNEAEPGSQPRIIYPRNLETKAAEAIATGDFDAVDREIEAMVGQWAAQYVGAKSGEPKGTRAGAKNKAPMIGALKMLGVLNDPLALKQAQRQAEEVDATMQAALEAQKTIEGWKLSPEEKEVMDNVFPPQGWKGQKVMDVLDEAERLAMPAAVDQALAEMEAAEYRERMEAEQAEIQAAKGAEIYQAEMMKLKARQDHASQSNVDADFNAELLSVAAEVLAPYRGAFDEFERYLNGDKQAQGSALIRPLLVSSRIEYMLRKSMGHGNAKARGELREVVNMWLEAYSEPGYPMPAGRAEGFKAVVGTAKQSEPAGEEKRGAGRPPSGNSLKNRLPELERAAGEVARGMKNPTRQTVARKLASQREWPYSELSLKGEIKATWIRKKTSR
jgi:hypothetical protein